MTIKDGRQWAKSLNEIRRDHVERYWFAAKRVHGLVADLGCGVGYGARILADAGLFVNGYDCSAEALAFAQEHWGVERTRWVLADLAAPKIIVADSAVAFELIEHIADPAPLLRSLNIPKLICSVPNQDVMPFAPQRHSYHHRHYTEDEFGALLAGTGWRVTGWFTQAGKLSPVLPGVDGMTLITECVR